MIWIRPAVRSRAYFDGFHSAPRKGHCSRCIRRHHDLNVNLPGLDAPGAFRQAVGRLVFRTSVTKAASGLRTECNTAVPGLGGREATYGAMQPVRDGSQCIVVV